MGVITIKMDDEVEKKFREAAEEEFDGKKGYLGKGITQAAEEWVKKKKAEDAKERLLKRMRKGYDLGEVDYDREEIHLRE